MSERTLSRSQGSNRGSAGRRGLADRRRRAKKRWLIALGILAVLVLAAIVWGLWQPAVRIAEVQVVHGNSGLSAYATRSLAGSYFGILPRDSTFFPPEHSIRHAILAAHPEIAAVSMYHTGLRTLGISVDERTAVARWCGLAPTPDVVPYCYAFDPGGFIYEALPDPTDAASSTASSTVSAELVTTPITTVNTFALYAPLASDTEEPLRATIAHAEILPAVFEFARKLSVFGSSVVQVYLHDGEVEDTLASGSRVRYVLGQEQAAFTALTSAKDEFNLANGSVDYIDARFPGKLYVKQKDKAPASTTLQTVGN